MTLARIHPGSMPTACCPPHELRAPGHPAGQAKGARPVTHDIIASSYARGEKSKTMMRYPLHPIQTCFPGVPPATQSTHHSAPSDHEAFRPPHHPLSHPILPRTESENAQRSPTQPAQVGSALPSWWPCRTTSRPQICFPLDTFQPSPWPSLAPSDTHAPTAPLLTDIRSYHILAIAGHRVMATAALPSAAFGKWLHVTVQNV